MAAETLEQVECAEAAFWIGNLLKELLAQNSPLPIECYTDSHQLYDGLYSIRPIKDKRLRIDIAILKQMILRKEVSKINWIHKESQLADCLTKSGASTKELINVLSTKKKR